MTDPLDVLPELDRRNVVRSRPRGIPRLATVTAAVFGIPAVTLLIGSALLIVADTVARYYLNTPFTFTSDLVKVLGAVSFLFALPAACALFAFSGGMAPLSAARPARGLYRLFVAMFFFAVLVFLAAGAAFRAARADAFGETLMSVPIPAAVLPLSVGIGALLGACTLVIGTVAAFLSPSEGDR